MAIGLILILGLVVLLPLLKVVGQAVYDTLHPLPDEPGPVSTLPPASDELAEGWLVFDSDRTGTHEIFVRDLETGEDVQLTDDDEFDSFWGRVSPDRTRILFYRSPAGTLDRDPTKNALWIMNVDGSAPVEIRPVGTDGWRLQGHAEWSPRGDGLVMAGGSRLNPQIYVTTTTGLEPRKLTARGGTNIDPSWGGDGFVYFVGCPGSICFESDYEVYRVPEDGGEVQRLTDDGMPDFDPYLSPDRSQVAWLTRTSDDGIGQWNIRIATVTEEGFGPIERVTDDTFVNSKPAWSADGNTIYFHRLGPDATTFSIFSIHPDGSAMTEITEGSPFINEYPGP